MLYPLSSVIILLWYGGKALSAIMRGLQVVVRVIGLLMWDIFQAF
jgi:hypothetical protein